MLRVYNTLTRQKEVFTPRKEGEVKMYACGITVSGDAHIGHAFQALIYDIIRKYLEKKGYAVTYARNYTDVDDKIIAKSKETGIPADEYAEMMIKRIDVDMRKFEVDDPTVWLKATTNIDKIISFVQELIKKDHAYATPEGDVYFKVESFNGYGKLSGRKLEDAFESVRIENEDNKINPLDFALWKSAKPGEICWDSPWGKGRPGWHIECSAMNRTAFGDQIDIHGGGRDLIFPHHENEIAQTEALTGKDFAKYWIHNGLIKVNGQKMSKSLGNSFLLADLLAEYSAETIKFALLQTNYRQDINIIDNLFPEADKHLYEFYKDILAVEESGLKSDGYTKEIDESFDKAMDDDFNTARAIADLYGYFKKIKQELRENNVKAVEDVNQIKKTYSLLGFFTKDPKAFIKYYEDKNKKDEAIPSEVLDLVAQRTEAKKAKDYALADSIRAKITELGFVVKDTPNGPVIEKL
ncbi:MAG: cysteine--tRNA ligase [Clostridia bacterium]|nr:cysteine--tRNA ligase [Clostridia bacterium]